MNSAFEFDFDDWAELARCDPEAFARRRDQVVEETCERIGGRSKPWIAGICWRIDIERQRCASPMRLCLKLSSLMWDRHVDMSEKLNVLYPMLVEQYGQCRVPEQRRLRLVAVSPSSVNRS